jgi:Mn-dependent DtxR family transcriptional regulator
VRLTANQVAILERIARDATYTGATAGLRRAGLITQREDGVYLTEAGRAALASVSR